MWRLRRVGGVGGFVDEGVGDGVVVVVVVEDVVVCCASLVPFTSRCESDFCVRACWSFGSDNGVAFSTTGLENSSFHSSSTSSVSTSSSCFAAALTSSSSRMVCIRFRSCLSRAISAWASCLRLRAFIWGRERSSWVSSERAYSTFCGVGQIRALMYLSVERSAS